MNNVDNEEIDSSIMAMAQDSSRKIALIVALVGKKFGGTIEVNLIIHARIKALVEAENIELKGDIDQWRFSEVKLREEREPSLSVFTKARSRQN